MLDLIVSRHSGLVQYMILKGLATPECEVISHVDDPTRLIGRKVGGVLPLHLAVLCSTVTSVELDIPAHMRGKEMTCEDMLIYSTGISTFVVRTKESVQATNEHYYSLGANNMPM